jgi:PII-like signaling protein/predicted transcriptional regulator
MQTGTVKRLMIFIDETDRWHGANLAGAIVDCLRKEGMAGATVLRGTVGFGVHGQVHTTAIVDLAVNLPVVIIAVDEVQAIDRVLPKLQEMVSEGLILVDEVQAIRKNGKSEKEQPIAVAPHPNDHLVSEYMDAAPITIRPEMKLAETIQMLIENHRAYLPVVGESGVLLGMVSSQDLLGRIVHIPAGPFRFFSLRGEEKHEARQDIKALTASQVMKTHFVAVEPNSRMVKAVQIMLHEHTSALPVVQDNKLVGILRLPDVLQKALSIELA